MKRILLMLAMMLPIVANAQFKLTKDGFISDDGQNYYVCHFEGKTASELYNSINAYVMSNFKNPDAVANKAENSMINLHFTEENAVPVKKWMGTKYANIDVNMVFYFKDGRMRIDSPIINQLISYSYQPNGKPAEYVLSGGAGSLFGGISLFKKNGDVKNEFAVIGLEDYINNVIKEIIEYISQGSNVEW